MTVSKQKQTYPVIKFRQDRFKLRRKNTIWFKLVKEEIKPIETFETNTLKKIKVYPYVTFQSIAFATLLITRALHDHCKRTNIKVNFALDNPDHALRDIYI